ncbi:MAG: PqqD family protein [Lachnospiraceae bacterium]|nr:PqqD family protein [Lachnospiraceae bacterium]
MKIKEGFMIRQLGDQYVVVALGKAADEFKGMIRLNKAGAFLWKQLVAQDMNKETLVAEMLNQYEIDRATVEKDAEEFIDKLTKAELLER